MRVIYIMYDKQYLDVAGLVREFTSYIHIILVQYNVVQIVTQKTTIKW
jgi:hypothetical protein